MLTHPNFLDRARGDLTDAQQWWARGVVLGFAAMAGLAVVAFTWLSEWALHQFAAQRAHWPWWPLLWTPLCTAGLVALTRRFAPGAAGSGIPQVMAAMAPSVGPAHRPLFVSLRLSIAKLFLTTGGLFAGLAIGREGPSVQIAAGVMLHARRWLPRRSTIRPQALLVAGGAAGIAAAFNAPLAGIMFAIEELTRKIEHRSSGLIISAIVLAGLIAVSIYGNGTYFGVIRVPRLDADLVAPGVAVVVGCGLVGGLFSRLLQNSIVGSEDRFSQYKRAHPVRFAAGCGLAIAVLGVASGGATFGSGYEYTRELLEGHGNLPLLYVVLRIVATWLAVWSGVPGGIFAPSLAIGAGLGHDLAQLAGMPTAAGALIALGMAAFLAAVTQAPLTAFIIVMEMVDGHAMVLSLMAAALVASTIARWVSHPFYTVLAEVQLQRIPPAVAGTSALSGPTPTTAGAAERAENESSPTDANVGSQPPSAPQPTAPLAQESTRDPHPD